MGKAWLSHFQNTDYCTVAQKALYTQWNWWHLKIDRCVWKLAAFTICSKRGLLHAKQDHSQTRAAGSTSKYFAKWLHTEAAHLAFRALLWCSPMAWQMGRSVRNLPRAALLLLPGRWSPVQHPQLLAITELFINTQGKIGWLMHYPAALSRFSSKVALISVCETLTMNGNFKSLLTVNLQVWEIFYLGKKILKILWTHKIKVSPNPNRRLME